MLIELDILRLTYGRSGLGHLDDGRVVFVERVAPGDRVRARIVREHARYVEAELVELLATGAARVTPPCPVVDACGGCPWQHVAYEEQLAAKQQAVVDALTRIAGIAEPEVSTILASPERFGYRNRLKLRFDRGHIGFYRAHTNSLVPIADCLLAEAPLRTGLPAVEQFVASLDTRVTRVEIARGVAPDKLVLALNSAGRLRRADTHRVRSYLATAGNPVTGVTMWGRGWRRTWGDAGRLVEATDANADLEQHGSGFTQVNTGANRLLVAEVSKAVIGSGAERVLELYAGAGNFTLPLAARCASIVAVDAEPASIEAGRAAARARRIRNVRFVAATAAAHLAQCAGAGIEPPDVLLLDPPRSGLDAVAAAAAALGAQRVVYVSCNPSTLARDLRAFLTNGYALTGAQPIDLFPQTFHVEIVCRLERPTWLPC